MGGDGPELGSEEELWRQLAEASGTAGEQRRALSRELANRVARRAAEAEAQRKRVEAIFAALPVGVVIADRRAGRIVDANEHSTRILAADVRGVALPNDALELHALDGRRLAGHEFPLVRALEGEVVTDERIRLRRPDGEWLTLEVNAAPVAGADGSVHEAVAVFWDVSASDRRERAEREFVANAAHELQTPLAAILSAAEVLIGGAKDDPEAAERFLDHIRRETDRVARLVRALLILARAQAQGAEAPAERVEVQPLLDEVALGLRPAAGVEVRVDCPAELTVEASGVLLEQAVAALGANAAKYAAGTIWLRAREHTSGAVVLEVIDDGPGIPSGEEERVFDRFYRAGARDGSGSGLGLAVVREAVRAVGGRIELRSRRAGGTIARVVLGGGRSS